MRVVEECGCRRACGRKLGKRIRSLVRSRCPLRARQQVLKSARVVTQNRSLPYAKSSASLDVNDIASLERRGSFFERLPSGCHAHVAAGGPDGIDDGFCTGLELAAGNRRLQRRSQDRRWQYLVETANRLANHVGEIHDLAPRLGVDAVKRDRRSERDEGARLIAHG